MGNVNNAGVRSDYNFFDTHSNVIEWIDLCRKPPVILAITLDFDTSEFTPISEDLVPVIEEKLSGIIGVKICAVRDEEKSGSYNLEKEDDGDDEVTMFFADIEQFNLFDEKLKEIVKEFMTRLIDLNYKVYFKAV